ncbi:protein FAR1-RELATED SEQUENCE 5-like [Carya illinoinensis]|uniref:protein FAR1-RELATED SEQUENCE 5-like n=1 Tax=Carya illinoinensis TaxID=32201 RepID=UPI001C71AA5A|nr:protein FAR1-RELATED SEQUENCE 5-like [Carya illinoinensis]
MGEEEDRMAPRPSTSTSQPVYTHQNDGLGCPNLDHHPHHMSYPLASNLEDFIRVDDSFRYQSSSNPEYLRQEMPPTSVTPNSDEFKENVGSCHDADEMFFDINEDLEGTTVVRDDERTKRDDDGKPVYLTIGCARVGKYHPKPNSNISKPRATTKTGCKAKVNAALNKNGKWVFTTTKNSHNHITVSPKKSRLLRSHKHLDQYSQRILELNDRAGIRMSKNFYSLVVDAGGYENLAFQEQDCRNYIDKARYLRLGKGGSDALNEYFKRMRDQNDGFISNMWMMREGYGMCFGKATYLTNRYGMPFAPFVGVNHHGQSILLRAGLLSSEDTHSFVWLFQMWLDCMKGRAPKSIITNQDRAMKNAIATITIEFEESWGGLLEKYDLIGNNWLQSLYEERSFWVPVFLKSVFWVGMSTTQRSKSMNAFFDGYVHAGTTLKEFVDQFDNALRKKVEVETTADFNSTNQTIPCFSPFNIEKQFQKVYTNAKFKEVQREFMGLMGCNCWLVSTQGCILTFDVLDEISFDEQIKRVHYSVYYNKDECEVKCTCGWFEMRGIICRHALRVCQLKNINVLPKVYFLDRWRKDLKRHYTLIRSSYDDVRGRSDTRNHELMIQRCSKLAAKISSNNDKVHAFLHYVDDFDKSCEGSTCQSTIQSKMTNPTVVLDKGKKILSSNVVRGKGRPPNKRKIPLVEKLATKRKKTGNCWWMKVNRVRAQDHNPIQVEFGGGLS